MLSYEQEIWKDKQLVCGIDEVGRGCMAGPLVVCSVILPIGYSNELINDSKSLSAKKRLVMYESILSDAIAIDLEVVNEVTIDDYNIYQATKLAMEALIARSKANYALVDAMPINSNKAVQSIIKGDLKSISIAAASIVAKVVRDEIMEHLDQAYPEYGLKNHKGYATKAHKEAINKYSITNFYRRSYKPVMEVMEKFNIK